MTNVVIMTRMVILGCEMASWAVAEAKAKFSELIETAREQGAQEITRNGKLVGVLMTEEELARRTRVSPSVNAPVGGETSGKRLWDALRCAPKDGVDVEFSRLKWKPRKVEL